MSKDTLYKLRRVNKRRARQIWDDGGMLSISLEAPTEPVGAESEREHSSTNPQTQAGYGRDFDGLVQDTMEWAHRYPGTQGIVWHEVQDLPQAAATAAAST